MLTNNAGCLCANNIRAGNIGEEKSPPRPTIDVEVKVQKTKEVFEIHFLQ
jgi:hypothetical protein